MPFIEAILNVVAPHECLGCHSEGSLLCGKCAAGLPIVMPSCYRCHALTENFRTCRPCKASPLGAVTAFTSYEGVAKELLWRLKFGRAKAAAEDIAALLGLPSHRPGSLLVHIPTASTRVRQRGYDQARLIAVQLGRRHNLRHVAALARLGQQRQVGTSGTERRKQLATAFRIARPSLVAGKHIILVDDILTTGATLEAAAKILKQAGARRVDAVVFARA